MLRNDITLKPPTASFGCNTMFHPAEKPIGHLLNYCKLVMVSIFRNGITAACVCAVLLSCWLAISLFSHTRTENKVLVSQVPAGVQEYFEKFKGFAECDTHTADLYLPSSRDHLGFYHGTPFCHDRKQLLKALSEGGRIGIDAPYQPRGCNYRWYQVEEICLILERFAGVVFIGDESLEIIYSGLNILLQRDLAFGALDQTSIDSTLLEACPCNNQYVREECRQHFLRGATKVNQEFRHGGPYLCNGARHALLVLSSPQLKTAIIENFKRLISPTSQNRYKPIPIIHSRSPAMTSTQDAVTSLLRIVELASESKRNTPILWVGPAAAGHIELNGRKSNQDIWEFSRKLADVAKENDIDVLGVWNMTIQATSWDGMRFGEQVAITQAMMVLNWLSRLESS